MAIIWCAWVDKIKIRPVSIVYLKPGKKIRYLLNADVISYTLPLNMPISNVDNLLKLYMNILLMNHFAGN